MRHAMKAAGMILASLLFSGCLNHYVAEDYPQYLQNNSGRSGLARARAGYEYRLPRETQEFSYSFRAGSAGIANKWIVEVGKILDATLQSHDVQSAFDGLKRASGDDAAAANLLVFEVADYKFAGYGVRVTLNISLRRSGTVAFSKTYTADGRTQGGKLFLGGAFAMKNAIQQSTKLALDDILREFINDLSKQAALPAQHRSRTGPGTET